MDDQPTYDPYYLSLTREALEKAEAAVLKAMEHASRAGINPLVRNSPYKRALSTIRWEIDCCTSRFASIPKEDL